MSDGPHYWLSSSCTVELRLTPGAPVRYRRLDLHRDGRECSDGDGEDEAHGQSHHPDLESTRRTQSRWSHYVDLLRVGGGWRSSEWSWFLSIRWFWVTAAAIPSSQRARGKVLNGKNVSQQTYMTCHAFCRWLMRLHTLTMRQSPFTCLKMWTTDTVGLASSSTRLTTGRFSAALSEEQTHRSPSVPSVGFPLHSHTSN